MISAVASSTRTAGLFKALIIRQGPGQLRAVQSTLAGATAAVTQPWSNSLSFASPDSDFSGGAFASGSLFSTSTATTEQDWSRSLSFASPESDFSGGAVGSGSLFSTSTATAEEDWSRSLSFAAPESDFCGMSSMLLSSSPSQQKVALPRTLKDALRQHIYQDKALVITTATLPHTIVYVNEAWQQMCGYPNKLDVLHKPIGKLLQGPDTNVALANSIPEQILHKDKDTQSTVDVYLVNYKASGESFLNHLTVGPLFLEEQNKEERPDKPQFLAGILEEVTPDQVPLRLVV